MAGARLVVSDNGDILSVDFVKNELEKKAADWRENFLSKASSMFRITDQIEAQFGGVVSEIEKGEIFTENKSRDKFFSGADPWLIAMARSLGNEATVVSSEKKSLSQYGLGLVCIELGVRHIDLVEFFDENNIGN